MQLYTICFIIAATTRVVELVQLNHTSGSSKQAWHISDAVCTVLELLMIGGEAARNVRALTIKKNIV